MVFDCPDHYPSGGSADFLAASLESMQDSIEKARKVCSDNSFRTEYDWRYSVFDTESLAFEEWRDEDQCGVP